MILVAYASKHGGTMEIAEKIGEYLVNEGFQVTVSDVEKVKDIKPYRAVILGSAVYIGKWQRQVVKFLKKNLRELAARKVWIFSSGPTGAGDPVELLDGWKMPEKLRPLISEIGPEDISVFHGVLIRERLGPLGRFMIDKVKSPVGDYRDWQKIRSWSEQIAVKLKRS
jgi:menaquinone-dependent protoporphyrinogen oxidase